MKTISSVCMLLFAALLVCSCFRNSGQATAEETQRTLLIKKFMALCDARSQDYPKEKIAYVKYYRKGTSPEIVMETRSVKGKEPNLTPEKQEAIRVRFIKQVGGEFSVGEIREYGKYGIVFTLLGLSHDGKELYRIPIRFD